MQRTELPAGEVRGETQTSLNSQVTGPEDAPVGSIFIALTGRGSRSATVRSAHHRLQHFHLGAGAYVIGHVDAQLSCGMTHALHALEARCAGASSTRIHGLFTARFDFGHMAWKVAAGAPQIDIEGERVLAGHIVDDPF